MFIKYGFLADTVTLDASGKASAIGIFEIIYTQGFPMVHRDMSLFVHFEGTIAEKGDHKFSVELRDRDGNRLMPVFEPTVKIANPPGLHDIAAGGLLLKLMDVPFKKAGQYEFVIFTEGRFVGRVTFSVQKIVIAPPVQDA